MPKLTKTVDLRAKNYISPEAQKRVLEVARAAAEDWANSNFVEAYPVYYYSVAERGLECSCQSTPLPHNAIDDNFVANQGNQPAEPTAGPGSSGSFVITYDRPMHESISPSDMDLEEPPISDELMQDPSINSPTDSLFLDDIFADGIDCAICQRLKVQPAYHLVDGQRHLLTSLNINEDASEKINIIQNSKPHAITVLDSDGFAEWSMLVPKYFTACRINVYNNTERLDPADYTLLTGAGATLTLAAINSFKGQAMAIRVRAEQFTHLSVEFDLPSKGVRVSLPQLQTMRDYTKFITIPVTNIIIENRIGEARVHDIVWCPKLGLMWKITEVKPIRLIDSYHVGWELQGRIVQPLEQALLLMPAATEMG